MSNLKNIRDLDDAALSPEVRARVQAFVDRGYDRNHLAVNRDGKVFFDKELAENDAFNEVFYGPLDQDE